LAEQLPEWRRGTSQHNRETLIHQWVFQMACGYADQDDAATLRTKPVSPWDTVSPERIGGSTPAMIHIGNRCGAIMAAWM
jgi:hypothetical protein